MWLVNLSAFFWKCLIWVDLFWNKSQFSYHPLCNIANCRFDWKSALILLFQPQGLPFVAVLQQQIAISSSFHTAILRSFVCRRSNSSYHSYLGLPTVLVFLRRPGFNVICPASWLHLTQNANVPTSSIGGLQGKLWQSNDPTRSPFDIDTVKLSDFGTRQVQKSDPV